LSCGKSSLFTKVINSSPVIPSSYTAQFRHCNLIGMGDLYFVFSISFSLSLSSKSFRNIIQPNCSMRCASPLKPGSLRKMSLIDFITPPMLLIFYSDYVYQFLPLSFSPSDHLHLRKLFRITYFFWGLSE